MASKLGFNNAIASACNQLKDYLEDVPEKMYYLLGMSVKDKGVCTLMRPCSGGGHEYMFGFEGLNATLKTTKFEVELSLDFVGFWLQGQRFQSKNWVFSLEDVHRAPAQIEARRHLAIGATASFKLPSEARDVEASIDVSGSISIDLDPLNNGMGGEDYMVLIEVEAGATVTVKKFLRFKPPEKLNVLLYWKYLNPSDYDIRILVQRQWSLSSLASSIEINAEAPGEEPVWRNLCAFFEALDFLRPTIDVKAEV